MSGPRRPLAGCMVGLSISECEDNESRGFPPSQINRLTTQIVSSLFGQGVGVVFGHDWREDGVMQAVYAIARDMQSAGAGHDGPPLLYNLLPWPDAPMLPATQREQLSSTLLVERAGLPDELRDYADTPAAVAARLPDYGYLRARALTHLRRRLEERTDARICIGGRRLGGQGRFPGIIEEALLTVTARKPLYLIGLLGGAAAQVIHALEGAPMPEDFCARAAGADVYQTTAGRLERSPDPHGDRDPSRDRVWATFREASVDGLCAHNGLTVAQNRELFHTPSIDHAMRLVLAGLARIHRGPHLPPGEARFTSD
jgi:hypothetical protein